MHLGLPCTTLSESGARDVARVGSRVRDRCSPHHTVADLILLSGPSAHRYERAAKVPPVAVDDLFFGIDDGGPANLLSLRIVAPLLHLCLAPVPIRIIPEDPFVALDLVRFDD